jgi:hypothetical protein
MASDSIYLGGQGYFDQFCGETCDFDEWLSGTGLKADDRPMVWRGYMTSKNVYHLEWDAPYDPTGILPKPRGYIVYSDNF